MGIIGIFFSFEAQVIILVIVLIAGLLRPNESFPHVQPALWRPNQVNMGSDFLLDMSCELLVMMKQFYFKEL